MLDYDMPLFRPPSEARSVIIQATLGCSHNECTFCGMYKTKRFRVRPLEEVIEEIQRVGRRYPTARKLFVADGDALVLKTSHLLRLLEAARRSFPTLERVSVYAMPSNILRKSPEELRELRDAGLRMLYVGVESGNDEVLTRVVKGATRAETIASGLKAAEAGFEVSAMVLLGLGGPDLSAAHIADTASALSEMSPDFASALSVMLGPFEEGYRAAFGRPWRELTKDELMGELRDLVAGIAPWRPVEFRSNHASNHLPIRGTLDRDRDALVDLIERAMGDPTSPLVRPEWMRAT
ncbi:MAG: radical SAM protein [Myxococcales bacterium]|nr:radical SAM protein [Myxococcales bacterium]